MSALAWGRKVSPEFRRIARDVAADTDIDANHLMAVMAFETGRTFRADIRNPASGGTGLIQHMPSTAKGFGTTTDELAAKTPERQLNEDVRRYFRQYKGRLRSLSDTYMAVLWPAAIGKPEDFVLIDDDDGKAYIQNRGLDLNKDGRITKAEATAHVERLLAEGLLPQNRTEEDETTTAEVIMPETSTLTTAAGGLLGMLNPIAGILFQAFAPKVQERLAGAVDRAGGTPGAGQAIANALSQAILGQATAATGKMDELEAVAVARQNPEIVASVAAVAQQTAEAKLKEFAPILEQTVEWDKAKWQAEREGRDAAADRIIKERGAGLWDMTKTLVSNTEGQVWFILVALATGVGAAFWFGKDAIAYAILTLSGPILGQVMKNKAQPNDYRFDGTKESSEQTQALTSIMQQDSANRGATR